MHGAVSVWDLDPTKPMGLMKSAWTPCLQTAGVWCRLHDLRHTFISAVSIHQQSRWLYGCWSLKGALSQPSEAKASYYCLHCLSTGNSREDILPEFSKLCCHPGRAGGSPFWIRRSRRAEIDDEEHHRMDDGQNAEATHTRTTKPSATRSISFRTGDLNHYRLKAGRFCYD